MHTDPPYKGTWVVAVNKQQLEGMDHYGYELGLSVTNLITLRLSDNFFGKLNIELYNLYFSKLNRVLHRVVNMINRDTILL